MFQERNWRHLLDLLARSFIFAERWSVCGPYKVIDVQSVRYSVDVSGDREDLRFNDETLSGYRIQELMFKNEAETTHSEGQYESGVLSQNSPNRQRTELGYTTQ